MNAALDKLVSLTQELGFYNATGEIMTPEQVARVTHEVNRAYCLALGDTSQPTWEDAPQWQRESAIHGVTFHTENPGAGAQASHESWMAQKLADGWTYGPEKRPDLKQHPCMVPFNELPVAQQAKDYIFRAVVHALMRCGLQEHRMSNDVPSAADRGSGFSAGLGA